MAMAREWRLRDFGDELIVEVWPAKVDADAERRSAQEIDGLVRRGVDRGDANVRRILHEAYAELSGAGSRPPSSDALRSELTMAVRAHRLLARRQARRVVAEVIEKQEEAVLGPAPVDDAEEELVWIGINLVNQDGEAVPARPYRVIAPDGQTHQGRLDSHGTAFVRGIPGGSCKVYCPDYDEHGELTHVVQPGEHISGIALAQGFEDYDVVWSHANNKDLAGKRDVAHALNEGDEVYIPELKSKPEQKPTGAKHEFTIKQSPLKLRVKLLGTDMKPVTNAACTMDGTQLTSDGDGVVEIPVDKLTPDSTLSVDGTDLTLTIGRLNTVDDATPAGWKARLFNMGFLVDPTVPDEDDELTFALQDFQAEYKLQVTGAFDDATKSKLKDVYGC
jgi:N-acetylmuramoyl-L-alanine amidase